MMFAPLFNRFSLVCAVLATSVAAPTAFAQTPTVRYAPQGTRQLIFVNNPERIELGYTDTIPGSATFGFVYNELADASLGRVALQKITVPQGNYRDAFEHVYNYNRVTTPSAAQNPIQYGVVLYNPNTTDVTVTIRGKGFINNSSGAAPFVELFSTPTAQTVTVPGDRFLWILRTDADFSGTRPIAPGAFFSGAVDFDFSGSPCVIYNVAYQSQTAVTGKTVGTKPIVGDAANLKLLGDVGFVTRRYSLLTTPAPESRVYKGLMAYPDTDTSGSDVATNLTFTVTDATATGELSVNTPTYVQDANTKIYAPTASGVTTNPFWITHTTPFRSSIAAVSDMFDILMPGYGAVYALAPVYASNTAQTSANIANWDIVYRDNITLVNDGDRARTFDLTLANSGGGGSPIAYQNNAGTWASTSLSTTPFAYRSVTVPARSTVTVNGVFVLGCPAVGTLRHAVKVNN